MYDAEDDFMLLNSHDWELTLNDFGEKPNLTQPKLKVRTMMILKLTEGA
jgi:hypothetical protein